MLGPTNVGKTLLTRRILAPLLGGCSDASSFFTGQDTWTNKLLQAPLAVVDDAVPVGSKSSRVTFGAIMKKVVANAELVFSEKYMQTGDVPFFGRILVLANLDSNSMQIIPEMDMSNRDKLILLKIQKHSLKFSSRNDLEREIAAELPNFARFLELWVPPVSCVVDDNRFSGVMAYKHPELFQEASDTGAAAMLFEMLSDFLVLYKEGHSTEKYWEGTMSMLYKDMCVANPMLKNEFSQRYFGIVMNTMLDKKRYRMSKSHDRHRNIGIWKIYFDLMDHDAKENTNDYNERPTKFEGTETVVSGSRVRSEDGAVDVDGQETKEDA